MSAGTLHIITVLYNSGRVLERFLQGLAAQQFRDWKLLAIDNASSDDTGAICARSADARLTYIRNETNVGYSRAVNQGLRRFMAGGGDLVLMMNNDTALEPAFLGALLDQRKRIGAQVLSPRIMRLDQPDLVWFAGGHFEDGWTFRNVHEHSGKPEPPNAPAFRTVDFVSGCCLLVERSVFERIGLFDESFFVYWEDADFCLRLTQAGIPIHYCREPVLLHDASKLTGGKWSRTFVRLYFRAYFQFLRKHFGLGRALRTLVRVLSPHYSQRSFGSFDIARWRCLAAASLRGMVSPLRPLPPP